MKSWSKPVRLTQPLRGAHLVRVEVEGGADPSAAALRESYERGRQEGQRALQDQLYRQRTEVQELAQGVLAQLRQAIPQVVRESEEALITLSLEVVRKLVGDLPITPALVEAAIKDALTHVEGTTEIIVRLHPEDLELLRQMASPLLSGAGEYKDMSFHGSAEVTRGGCMVQTRFGLFDARRETKLDLLKRTLLA